MKNPWDIYQENPPTCKNCYKKAEICWFVHTTIWICKQCKQEIDDDANSWPSARAFGDFWD